MIRGLFKRKGDFSSGFHGSRTSFSIVTHLCPQHRLTLWATFHFSFIFERYFDVLHDLLLSKEMDQRIGIKFCVTSKSTCSNSLKMLTMANYGKVYFKQNKATKWCKLCTEVREDVNDDVRPGSPRTSKINGNAETVKNIVMKSWRITFRDISEDDGISVGSCYAFFSNVLGTKRDGYCTTIRRRLTSFLVRIFLAKTTTS